MIAALLVGAVFWIGYSVSMAASSQVEQWSRRPATINDVVIIGIVVYIMAG